MSTHVYNGKWLLTILWKACNFFIEKPASQIWWTWRNYFPQKKPGDLKNLPFKMVADSDGLLVQPTSEHRNFESRTSQKEVSSSNDSFSGVMLVYRSVALEILKHVGIVFSQIFAILGTEDVKMFLFAAGGNGDVHVPMYAFST